eukprot:1063519_1
MDKVNDNDKNKKNTWAHLTTTKRMDSMSIYLTNCIHLYDVGLRTNVMQNEGNDNGDVEQMNLLCVDRAFAQRIQIIKQKRKQCPKDERFRSSNHKYTLQTQADEPVHRVASETCTDDTEEETFLDGMYQFILENYNDVESATVKCEKGHMLVHTPA